jgi:DNA modification methylase
VGSSRTVSLHWEGKDAVPLPVPAGAALGRWPLCNGAGELIHGDNLVALRSLAKTHTGKITLGYLDPPFFTGRVFDHIERGTRVKRAAFDDRWLDRAAYLEALAPRIEQMRHLLAPHGSIVVHVDPKTSHYVKVLCDEIFGEDAFASEIVWRYRRWPSKTPNFQRVHDVLLRYRKDPSVPPRWNPVYEPLAASTLKTWGTKKQRAVFTKGANGDVRRAHSSSTEEATEGAPMGDVWEIGVIAPVAHERTGYPSQKPEALLERLLTALTAPGDLVLDPYAGSGTTLAVAAKMGRRFVGIDASDLAIETIQKRMGACAVEPRTPSLTASR